MEKKRKKKKRWLLYTSLVVVLLVVLGGGYALYEFKFKSYDVADEKVDEIIEDNYEIKLPDGTEVTVDQEGNIIEKVSEDFVLSTDETSSATDSTSTDGTNETSTTSTGDQSSTEKSDSISNNDSTHETAKPTVKSIKEMYTPSLEALQAQATSRINGLIANAKAEYKAKKANGESISIGYFYNKYMGAAESLEASTDAAFNSILSIIERDLAANGFDKSHAQSLRDDYEAMKQARRDSILSQVKGAL